MREIGKFLGKIILALQSLEHLSINFLTISLGDLCGFLADKLELGLAPHETSPIPLKRIRWEGTLDITPDFLFEVFPKLEDLFWSESFDLNLGQFVANCLHFYAGKQLDKRLKIRLGSPNTKEQESQLFLGFMQDVSSYFDAQLNVEQIGDQLQEDRIAEIQLTLTNHITIIIYFDPDELS